MSEHGSETAAPGWYPAQGDPPNTHRYWDGQQWVGEPQHIGGPPLASPPPAYGSAVPTLRFAPMGRRFVAFLIDNSPYLLGFLLAIVAPQDSPLAGLGGLLFLIWFLSVIGNMIAYQGITGHSIGKKLMGMRIVHTEQAMAPGVGRVFGRLIVAWLLSTFSLGLYGLADHIAPFVSSRNQRLTDKMFDLHVVDINTVPAGSMSAAPRY